MPNSAPRILFSIAVTATLCFGCAGDRTHVRPGNVATKPVTEREERTWWAYVHADEIRLDQPQDLLADVKGPFATISAIWEPSKNDTAKLASISVISVWSGLTEKARADPRHASQLSQQLRRIPELAAARLLSDRAGGTASLTHRSTEFSPSGAQYDLFGVVLK